MSEASRSQLYPGAPVSSCVLGAAPILPFLFTLLFPFSSHSITTRSGHNFRCFKDPRLSYVTYRISRKIKVSSAKGFRRQDMLN